MISAKLHRDRDEIVHFCKKFKSIHLYGAGDCAKLMCEYLDEENILVSDIIVSDGHKNEKKFIDKYNIYELSEINLSDDDGVIIALKKDIQKEVYDLLINNGISPKCIYKQRRFFWAGYGEQSKASLLDIKKDESSFFLQHDELNQIGTKCETDKSSQYHNYLKKYEFFLKNWRERANCILELGVYKGASLKMWSQYFQNATVYGVDIDEACKQYEDENIRIIIKDLGDEQNLIELGKLNPQIVIDDASHLWSHQIKALVHLLPALKSGGIYILEDLGTSFYSYRHAGYDDACVSAYDFCSALTEVVCSREYLRLDTLNANLVQFKEEIEYLGSQIDMMAFIYESCIIVKK